MGAAVVNLSEEMKFYFADKANQSAIRQVLGGPGEDFGWDELDQFYDVWLSAQKVKVGYWRLMREIWDCTWGEAIRQSSLQEVNFWGCEMKGDWYGGENFLDSVWSYSDRYGYFYKGFGSGRSDEDWEVMLGVWGSRDELALGFSCYRHEGYVLDMKIEEGDWSQSWEESWSEGQKGDYVTGKASNLKLAPLGGDGMQIDVSPLYEQARKATEQLYQELNNGS